MKAILKCKHVLFCSLVQTVKNRKALEDTVLDEMLDDLAKCFDSYVQNKDELLLISQQYESKQRRIKQRLKELGKTTARMPDSF